MKKITGIALNTGIMILKNHEITFNFTIFSLAKMVVIKAIIKPNVVPIKTSLIEIHKNSNDRTINDLFG